MEIDLCSIKHVDNCDLHVSHLFVVFKAFFSPRSDLVEICTMRVHGWAPRGGRDAVSDEGMPAHGGSDGPWRVEWPGGGDLIEITFIRERAMVEGWP